MTAAPPGAAAPERTGRTLARGLRLSPEFRRGLSLTLALALVASGGRLIVPVAVQVTIDRGLLAGGPDGPDVDSVLGFVGLALVAVLLTVAAGFLMNFRLARATETALSNLRVRTFRHIHDLSVLHHASEHRGALVSRVTADVDTISQFMQWGGVVLVVNLAQLLLATGLMAFYSWQLTLVVLLTFAPLLLLLRWFQRRLSEAYDLVRVRVGAMLTAFSESVVGAPVIRAYGIEERTQRRLSRAVDRRFEAQFRAARFASFMFSSGEVFAALATAAAVIVGVLLGVGGELSAGRLVAFLFLVALFVGPVQVATEVLDQAQTAIAGWRRVLDVLDTPADVADPSGRAEDGPAGGGLDIPPGPITVRFEHVGFRYPLPTAEDGSGQGPPVLHDVDLTIPAGRRVAVVGETGSGKTTFAKLLTRLMDPTGGRVLLNGVPLESVRFASLRRRVVMVPQDGFLFDASIEDNVRRGRPDVGAEDVRRAFADLGLSDWLRSLPDGLATRTGEGGESLSVGERQLVALARAYVADPDLLVLDEATSAVDPATDVRLQGALERLMRGRTAVAIAHRLSTAEVADEVLVFDAGRVVQRGAHAELARRPGVYARLQASWTSTGASRAPGSGDRKVRP